MARLEYDFDRVVDRTNTNSIKWNFCEELFGAPDVLPMWVADMDFKTPQPVIDALVQVAEHGIYGYSKMRDNYYQAVTSWSLNRHGWELNPDWIVFSPGIVPALSWLIKAFTVPGDKVVLQSPVYPPFFKAAEKNGCQVLNNQLVLEDGRYTMDFVDLEEKLADGAKLLLLCSPHNPVGRVWRREELQRVGTLCAKYNVKVISDEIHCDLIYPGNQHLPFSAVNKEFAANSVVCTAPSKTFNLAGIQASNIIIPNDTMRRA
ncbi:MAG TPA: PatB family C-S lyase, partial [Desulfobacteria bacterium]|nr:PatB family C-S lyase [Desulfobacteria bacterium]